MTYAGFSRPSFALLDFFLGPRLRRVAPGTWARPGHERDAAFVAGYSRGLADSMAEIARLERERDALSDLVSYQVTFHH